MSETIYIERGDVELEIEIEGRVHKGSPQTYWEPADPDEVEVESAVVAKAAEGFPEGTVIELTPGELEKAEQALLDGWEEPFDEPEPADFDPDKCTGDCFYDQ